MSDTNKLRAHKPLGVSKQNEKMFANFKLAKWSIKSNKADQKNIAFTSI